MKELAQKKKLQTIKKGFEKLKARFDMASYI